MAQMLECQKCGVSVYHGPVLCEECMKKLKTDLAKKDDQIEELKRREQNLMSRVDYWRRCCIQADLAKKDEMIVNLERREKDLIKRVAYWRNIFVETEEKAEKLRVGFNIAQETLAGIKMLRGWSVYDAPYIAAKALDKIRGG